MHTSDIEKLYERHSRFYDLTRPLFLRRRKEAIELLDIREGERVVDFACGTGLNIPFLRNRRAGRILGVDISEAMLGQARKRFPEIHFVRRNILEFHTEEKFDKGVCTYALSMIEDVGGAVARMKDALSLQGALVIVDFYPLLNLARPLNPIFKWWLGRYGVSIEKPIHKLLEKNFEEVISDLPRLGYAFIARARRPRPQGT